ncbi:DUF1351 domain-containing protein [Lancefieldella parvula]|uniref:DUF1351 domain-containing protein n=1 Tax=Lancefieldella parvula TaxID=1382 RepID=UPI0028D2A246|nr:DUF1351 domain-containing protein [Lancefieldella parvula]
MLTAGDKWLAEARSKAATIAAQYQPHDITNEADYKDAKSARAMLRKEIAAIDSDRKSMTSTLENAISRFKAHAAEAIGELTALESAYKSNITDYEDRWESTRRSTLQEEYETYAPDIALPLDGQQTALVPFELLLKRFGTEGKWLNRSTNERAAVEHLRKCIDRVASDIKNINATEMDDRERVEVKGDYFSTLEFANTMSAMIQRRVQRDKTKQLEREQRERERQWQEQQERANAGVEALKQWQEQQEQPQSAPQPAQTAAESQAAPQETEPVMKLIIEVEVTPTQRGNLLSWLKANNIHGVLKRN